MFEKSSIFVVAKDAKIYDGDIVLVQFNKYTPCLRRAFIEGSSYYFKPISELITLRPKDKSILYDINPYDLIKISNENHIELQKKAVLSINEVLRNNQYKLSDANNEVIFSGDEICENIVLIEKIKNIDIYKIAYNTGFNHGRQLAREIGQSSIKNKPTSLKVVKNDVG